MGRRLAVNVTVGADTYSAGSEAPDEVAELITNPKVWADEAAPEVGEPGTEPEVEASEVNEAEGQGDDADSAESDKK